MDAVDIQKRMRQHMVAFIAVLVLAWTAGLLVRSIRDSREVRRREDVANRERALVEYRYAVEQERNRRTRRASVRMFSGERQEVIDQPAFR